MQKVTVDIIYLTKWQNRSHWWICCCLWGKQVSVRFCFHREVTVLLWSSTALGVSVKQMKLWTCSGTLMWKKTWSKFVFYSQHKVLVPHRVKSLRLDLGHLDASGGQHLLGTGAFLQLFPPLPEAEFSLLLLLCFPGALAHQDSQHAVGVTVTWKRRWTFAWVQLLH